MTETIVGNKISKNRRLFFRYWHLYVMALPAIILMLVYRYVPMTGLMLAFTDYSAGMAIKDVDWVGLKWFRHIFANYEFMQVLWNTIYISILKLIFSFPAPILLAIFLNEMGKEKFKRAVQTVIYMPHFLSWTILAGIIFTLLSTQSGIVKYFGVESSLLLDPDAFRPLLVITDMWKEAGWGTIVYLAAITSINSELYEAAMIDGASRFRMIKSITLPCISSTIIVLLILKMGNILDAGFDQVFMLYNSAVYSVADILDTYVYRIGMSQGRFGLATAAGLFKSVVGLVMVIITNKVAKHINPENGIL